MKNKPHNSVSFSILHNYHYYTAISPDSQYINSICNWQRSYSLCLFYYIFSESAIKYRVFEINSPILYDTIKLTGNICFIIYELSKDKKRRRFLQSATHIILIYYNIKSFISQAVFDIFVNIMQISVNMHNKKHHCLSNMPQLRSI